MKKTVVKIMKMLFMFSLLIFLIYVIIILKINRDIKDIEITKCESTAYSESLVSKVDTRSESISIVPEGNRFYALHGGITGNDEINIPYAMDLQQKWTSEEKYFLPEGPTFDSEGHAYITPLIGDKPPILISLDRETGKRRFAIDGGYVGQGGAPLILNNENGGEIIYAGSYSTIIAASTEGELLWQTDTGLPIDSEQDAYFKLHLYGINYQPQADVLIACYANGYLVALDRSSGALMGTYLLPGAPAKPSGDMIGGLEGAMNAPILKKVVARKISKTLGILDLGEESSVEASGYIMNALLGGGTKISNYFSVDPTSSRIWVAGTMDAAFDNNEDGMASYGALYGIDIIRKGEQLEFDIKVRIPFEGGSASTPAVKIDGQRIYVADSYNSVLAFDTEGNQIWKQNVGSQVVGSIAVSSSDPIIYASTGKSVFKIRDNGANSEIIWKAQLEDIYKNVPNYLTVRNLNLAGIGTNGIMVQTGAGFQVGDKLMPVEMSITLLNIDDGTPMNSVRAREETVSVISSTPQGGVAIGNSAVRRVATIVIGSFVPFLNTQQEPIIGGVTMYAPE